MATEARKFRVGVFTLVAVAILIGTIIWLGASRFFERTLRLDTYFSESVQGLEPGAAVKYRGVPSGRVEEIRIAPDGDLIEVVMSMDPDQRRISLSLKGAQKKEAPEEPAAEESEEVVEEKPPRPRNYELRGGLGGQ